MTNIGKGDQEKNPVELLVQLHLSWVFATQSSALVLPESMK